MSDPQPDSLNPLTIAEQPGDLSLAAGSQPKSCLVEIATTLPDAQVADAIARCLVQARAVACAQVSETLRSTYWWQGVMEQGDEVKLILKTTSMASQRAIELLRQSHPYTTPEITLRMVEWVEPSYLQWVIEETQLR